MKVAVTGGTGFVGGHLARALVAEGHQVVAVARGVDRRDPELARTPGIQFFASDLSDAEQLVEGFAGCEVVAHCAGINREIGDQTYERVHVRGTANVLEAASRAQVRKVILLSFLRARPDCGSAYHESKWAAEEMVRNSSLDYTVIKSGMIYGRGDHMLDHLSRLLCTMPLLATVGLRERLTRPLAIADLVRVLQAAIIDGRLSRRTVAITGPEELFLSEAVRRVARVLGRRVLVVAMPVWFHYGLAVLLERIMTIPLASRAQVRILSEGVVAPARDCDPLPADLSPRMPFTAERIEEGLPVLEPFGLKDLRCCVSR
jgi:NADH dehydrogenase